MLASSGQAILDKLAGHRAVVAAKLREIGRLPQLELEALLQRYVADAPAFYLLPGSFHTVEDDDSLMVIEFDLAGVVRNVAGSEEAFAGDGQDIGVDYLLLLAMRALHGHQIGGCTWRVKRGAMVDDPLFDQAGIAAVEIHLESSPLPVDADWLMEELDDFQHFHADIDIQPFAVDPEAEYASWLATPPVYTTDRPDADLDVTLEGAS
jgi:hypothetical protein